MTQNKGNVTIKVLNLYAGIGGNRKLWENVDVTAVEIDPEIAKVYQSLFPEDKVVVGDAHEYLLQHYKEFDFIWSSPPCPTHSRMRLNHKEKVYPDMRLYQEVVFLEYYFDGKWVVENVISFYEPLIQARELERHFFWSNFLISDIKIGGCNVGKATKEVLAKYHDMPMPKAKNQRLLLRNCVHPQLGLHIFKCAFTSIVPKLSEFYEEKSTKLTHN